MDMSSIGRAPGRAHSARLRWRALMCGTAALALAAATATPVSGAVRAGSADPLDRREPAPAPAHSPVAVRPGEDSGLLTVVTEIVPRDNEGEDVTGAEPAGAGWRFDAGSAATGVDGLSGSRTTTGDGTGSVDFGLFHPPGTGAAPVTVKQSLLPGYGLVTQDGANAVCRDLSADGERLLVSDEGSGPEGPGFTVDVPAGSVVTCTVYNRRTPAEVVVDERWTVDGRKAVHVDGPDGLDPELTLTGPGGDARGAGQDWGEVRGGYAVGDTVTIVASAPTGGEKCVLTGSRLTGANGRTVDEPVPADVELTERRSAYTVTHSVVCDRAAAHPPSASRTRFPAEPGEVPSPLPLPSPSSGPGGEPSAAAASGPTVEPGDRPGGPDFGDLEDPGPQGPLALTGTSMGFAISGALLLTGLGLGIRLIARERRYARSDRDRS
jgi:hypothetical protein